MAGMGSLLDLQIVFPYLAFFARCFCLFGSLVLQSLCHFFSSSDPLLVSTYTSNKACFGLLRVLRCLLVLGIEVASISSICVGSGCLHRFSCATTFMVACTLHSHNSHIFLWILRNGKRNENASTYTFQKSSSSVQLLGSSQYSVLLYLAS